MTAINDERSGEDEELDGSQTSTSDSEGEEKIIKVADSIQIKDLSLKIHKGEFICIIGGVGSGKSSLISALLGDMIYMDQDTINEFQGKKMDDDVRNEIIQRSHKFKGEVKLGGSVSYVQHTPWIQNKTIRDNILFGLPMDEDKYNKIIELCELASDLEILPGGDLTEIGEKGINLSGGQKARVSLARAVYADREILLMDDPISALDSNVKKSIFKNLFLSELKHKTRILVTHAVEFLDKVDRVIIMEKGRIKYFAPYEDLSHSEEIQHIIETLAKVSVEEEEKETEQEKKQLEELKEKLEEENKTRKSFVSEKGTKITDDENEERIDVGWSIYANFFFSKYTWIFYIIAVPLTVVSSFLMVENSIMMGKWIDREHSKDKFWQYFTYVLLLSVGYGTIITVVSIVISLATVRISKLLHYDMLDRTAHAPINLYFDKTQTGRILNRYSSDINKIDNAINQ
jgi:ATP-binding cassette, subfamily C (CFTR/MRP), member 1